jgi:hypothetical protein
MPAVAVKNERSDNVNIVRKMKDYSNKPAFKKKTEDATAFIKKNGRINFISLRLCLCGNF